VFLSSVARNELAGKGDWFNGDWFVAAMAALANWDNPACMRFLSLSSGD
jgi:hypothetical protein